MRARLLDRNRLEHLDGSFLCLVLGAGMDPAQGLSHLDSLAAFSNLVEANGVVDLVFHPGSASPQCEAGPADAFGIEGFEDSVVGRGDLQADRGAMDACGEMREITGFAPLHLNKLNELTIGSAVVQAALQLLA